MLRVSYEDLYTTLLKVLRQKNFSEARAKLCARLFTETSQDGVHSHGLNRFPRFITMIDQGTVDVEAEPELLKQQGAIEQWDGKLGPGNCNAYQAMQRAIDRSRQQGIACVALQNTNHWMRGGTYGWQAANAGTIGVCWTNTNQNMPPWGASEPRIGNNPLVIAVPREGGHVVLDMAMSQFSYGSLESYRRKNKQLPVPGGFGPDNELTHDPGAIEKAGRPLPIGFWKGSGLSIMLDMVAALLSGGKPTHQITSDPLQECELSQVFISFDLQQLYTDQQADVLTNSIVEHLHASTTAEDSSGVFYPGERTLQRRQENIDKGIPVDPEIWEQVQQM